MALHVVRGFAVAVTHISLIPVAGATTLSPSLQDKRETLPDPDADRHNRDPGAAAPEFVSGMADDPPTGGPERVPDRERPAVHIRASRDPDPASRRGTRVICDANASFSSTSSTSAQVLPARASARFAASIGAVGNASGSTPCTARPANPGERLPSSTPSSGEQHSRGPVIDTLKNLPAVTVPSRAKQWFQRSKIRNRGPRRGSPRRARAPPPGTWHDFGVVVRRPPRRPRHAGASGPRKASCASASIPHSRGRLLRGLPVARLSSASASVGLIIRHPIDVFHIV